MGAMITVRYDQRMVTDEEAAALSKGVQTLVAEAMTESDVIVYTDASAITVAIEPIEVFVQINARKVSEPDALIETIAQKLANWKRQAAFNQPINLNVIPVNWYSKIGI